MNLKILSFTIIIFNIYSGTCSIELDQDEQIKELRTQKSDPEKRKLFLGFLGTIFKPIIRGIADAVAPPPPPPPPPPPQVVYQPHPQAAPNVPTATVEPVKKEEPKKDDKDSSSKESEESESDDKSEDESEENEDEGSNDDGDNGDHEEEEDDDEED